jgi:zinc/manganese transport system permease protein
MADSLIFLSTPVAAGVILAGLLGYFGTHILTRGIIFIDIAISQIAALGAMTGILLGFAEESGGAQFISYLLTLVIISAFALLRTRDLFIPVEAVIGIIYCIGLALALLLAEKIQGGSNYITKTITGNLLWVTWNTVARSGFLLAGLVLVHLLFGKQFMKLTDTFTTDSQTVRDRLLNMLFYIVFGLIVVKAVMIAGIFLVFTLLIAPSAAAAMFCKSWKCRLIWSWIIGVVGTTTGILVSYYLNISNGPAIVCLLGLLVFLLAFIRLFSPQYK